MFKAKCDLRVEIDRPERRFMPGERITGAVLVEVDAETKCKALPLTLGWSTHGKGNRASADAAKINLFSGTWFPGSYRYPFDLPCPASPLTYHGELLNVDWYLTTTADVPWALDPEARQDLRVQLPPGSLFDVSQGSADTQASGCAQAFGLIILGFMALAGLIPLGAAITEGNPFMALFSLFWWGILGGITWVVVKQRVAKSAFSKFEASVRHFEANQLTVSVQYRTRRTMNMVTAKLEVEEVVIRGSGTDATTYRETRHSDARPLVVNAAGQQHHEFVFELPNPELVGFSFDAVDNDLVWKVVLDCDIDQWPDLEETIPLQVRPRPMASLGGYR
ncbi:hypothetical protein [Plesiocystis pacifica]|nr:hypothetical protein [Plesiocystis pacifica]